MRKVLSRERLYRLLSTDIPEAVSDNKRIILGLTLIFFVLGGIAFSANKIGDNPVNDTIEKYTETTREILRKEAQVERSQLEWTIFLLQNNLRSAILTIVLGPLLGILPLIALLTNGLIIGYAISTSTLSNLGILSMILPHGVFELTGFIIAISCGLKLGIGSLKSLYRRELEPLKKSGREIVYLIPVPIIFIIIAGFIEGTLGAYQMTVLNSVALEIGLIVFGIFSLGLILSWLGGWLTNSSGRREP